METTRVKWDEGILAESFAIFNQIRPTVTNKFIIEEVEPEVFNPVTEEESETLQELIPEQESKVEEFVEVSDEWKDFVNDIDWAMM